MRRPLWVFCGDFADRAHENQRNWKTFPVFSQPNREVGGDRFAADCAHRHFHTSPAPLDPWRVVVLGGSHRHSNDLHLTPVGVMPGAYVIINSIVSLLTFGVVEAPPYWIAVATNLGLVILVSALLVMVRTAWVKVFFNILLVPALSWFAFKEGVWFGVAVPIISVQAFDIIYEIWDRNSPSRKP